MGKIVSYREVEEICEHMRRFSTIGLKTGCFDLLHIGHLRMFQECRTVVNTLIVGVGSNRTIEANSRRTVFDETNRAEMLAGIHCIDFVVILKETCFGNMDHTVLMRTLRPDYFFICRDDKNLEAKEKLAASSGSKVILQDPVSVTNFGKRIEPHSSLLKVNQAI